MSDFEKFAFTVHQRYNELSKYELFIVGGDNRAFSEAYLKAFPDGTNPIYKTNTEHDCTCCKNFIRNLGNLVAIIDGKVQTVWDDACVLAPYPYDEVAKKMRNVVLESEITCVFRSKERSYGAQFTRQDLGDGKVKKWSHFHGKVSDKHFTPSPGSAIGIYNSASQVFARGLEELTPEAFNTAIDLIEAKALYRGEEHLTSILAFKQLQVKYQALGSTYSELLFVWENAMDRHSRFRNTVIGTLLVDLSEGVDLDIAVKSFEAKVAPANYKRPTALITQSMVKDAMKTINELGLEPALERRMAKLSDVSVNNVLWVNREAQSKMKGGIEGILMDSARAPKRIGNSAKDVSIHDFMENILPLASSIEVLFNGRHQGNLVTLTAPVHEMPEKLFKWDNGFAWSYNGNVTDSIKDRVKKAGGAVEGDLCCRLAWDYKDDLDFHMVEPGGGHIFFPNRRTLSACGGVLDLDANGADGAREDPAENIVYADKRRMREGKYLLRVNNYSRRSDGVGFEVEVEFDGQRHNMVYDKVLKTGDTIDVAVIEYSKADGFQLMTPLSNTKSSVDVWGIKTETFVKVNTMMYSPNYWDGNAVGNKHWFFIIDACKNPDSVRGIYNEFLDSGLEKHRKVFEVLGSKTKCEPAEDQLSGLGFSSTKGDSITVKVTATSISEVFNVIF